MERTTEGQREDLRVGKEPLGRGRPFWNNPLSAVTTLRVPLHHVGHQPWVPAQALRAPLGPSHCNRSIFPAHSGLIGHRVSACSLLFYLLQVHPFVSAWSHPGGDSNGARDWLRDACGGRGRNRESVLGGDWSPRDCRNKLFRGVKRRRKSRYSCPSLLTCPLPIGCLSGTGTVVAELALRVKGVRVRVRVRVCARAFSESTFFSEFDYSKTGYP